ncbi:MAG TPA: FAD/NAD(P)-binding oxidoreductase [Solirubrobacteraceae bacterium]|nr:FAD/NAD(P)-binding oxidoreductase [Solirubrobacteraceae bacterium]
MSGRIVIVGAGPAGLATARAYRENGGTGAVTMIGSEPRAPYRRPPLTKAFLRGEMPVEELPLARESWYAEHEVELRLGCTAREVDPDGGAVETDEGELRAEAIVLATGSEPVLPPLPGVEHPDVLTVREQGDSERVAQRARPGAQVLVLGSGFIGCEIAGSLALNGAHVTMIAQEDAPQQERLGGEVAARLAGWLGELGVELVAGARVEEVEDGRIAVLDDGRRVVGECMVLGTGSRPRVELAEAAGASVEQGAVAVDEHMRASDRLLAVGDVACAHNPSAGRRLRVEHWGDALAHGEIAGKTLAGAQARWDQVPGFWSTIGRRTLKYAAWGDGYDASDLVEHGEDAFTVWYSRAGRLVGVLTSERDEDYERGQELIRGGRRAP